MLYDVFLGNIGLITGWIVTAIVVVVAMQFGMKTLQKDVAQIKLDVSAQRDKDAEHDIKFAEIEGEVNILKIEQKNLREYAINGIDKIEQAISKLREDMMDILRRT